MRLRIHPDRRRTCEIGRILVVLKTDKTALSFAVQIGQMACVPVCIRSVFTDDAAIDWCCPVCRFLRSARQSPVLCVRQVGRRSLEICFALVRVRQSGLTISQRCPSGSTTNSSRHPYS